MTLFTSSQPNIASILHFETSTATQDAYLVLPLSLGGDLFAYINQHPSPTGLSNAEAKFVFYQLASGLEVRACVFASDVLVLCPDSYPLVRQYLHKHNFAHRGRSDKANRVRASAALSRLMRWTRCEA